MEREIKEMSKYDELIEDLQLTALKLKEERFPNVLLMQSYADKLTDIYYGLKNYATGRKE